jgi:GSH-dependent disulfide-bond oxidoreductase
MIDLCLSPSPNGHRISILLEETGLEYRVVPIGITWAEQVTAEVLKMSPNGDIPAIVDHNGPYGSPISVCESGAILLYLAGKTGQFMPKEVGSGYKVIEWLMFQIGTVGPILEQLYDSRHHTPEQSQCTIERCTREMRQIYGVIDKRLAQESYLAGEYSIADIAMYPWVRLHEEDGQALTDFPSLARWYDTVSKRPAVKRGSIVSGNGLTS